MSYDSAFNRITDEEWRGHVQGYKADPFSWDRRELGARPGHSGCRVPSHILDEFGYPIVVTFEPKQQQRRNGGESAKDGAAKANDRGGAPQNDSKHSGSDELITVRASEVRIRAIRWLWPNRFALGKVGIIGGMPDMGKGLITANIIAAVTKSGKWPCKEGQAPIGHVILLTAEDDLDDTIAPRLSAAGADMSRVHVVRMVKTKQGGRRMFSLITDLALLVKKINDIGGVVLVVVDPLSAYLGVGKIDGYRTTDVRGVLAPLAELASEHRVSIIGVMHFNKNANITNAMLRLSDSLAFVATSRHAYVVADEPDSQDKRKLFLKAKNNLSAPETKALAYTFGVVTVGFDEELKEAIAAPRVLWAGEHVDMTAEQALQAQRGVGDKRDHPTAKDDAIELLKDVIPPAERVLVTDLEATARAAGMLKEGHGITYDKPFRDARKELGIRSEREGFGPGSRVYWRRPYVPSDPIGAPQTKRAPMDEEGTYGEPDPHNDTAEEADGDQHPGAESPSWAPREPTSTSPGMPPESQAQEEEKFVQPNGENLQTAGGNGADPEGFTAAPDPAKPDHAIEHLESKARADEEAIERERKIAAGMEVARQVRVPSSAPSLPQSVTTGSI
jgi:putative DNA primase/helicase